MHTSKHFPGVVAENQRNAMGDESKAEVRILVVQFMVPAYDRSGKTGSARARSR